MTAATALTTAHDAPAVARLAGAAVAADPVAYTIFGTIARMVYEEVAAPWAAHPADRPAVLAARSQPRSPVTFTAGWTDADLVAAAHELRSLDPAAASVSGPPPTVAALADALGRPVASRMAERLFRLDELVPPRAATGSPRLAVAQDVGWLAEWFGAFADEAFGGPPPGFDARRMIARSIRNGSRCWIWVAGSGEPRSFATGHPAVDGVSRIGPVYTPREHRGHGYASAATAQASRDILDRGDVACLFTDAANPTSNKIYQALGYRFVLDRATVRFD